MRIVFIVMLWTMALNVTYCSWDWILGYLHGQGFDARDPMVPMGLYIDKTFSKFETTQRRVVMVSFGY